MATDWIIGGVKCDKKSQFRGEKQEDLWFITFVNHFVHYCVIYTLCLLLVCQFHALFPITYV